jgi:hypothetical protein
MNITRTKAAPKLDAQGALDAAVEAAAVRAEARFGSPTAEDVAAHALISIAASLIDLVKARR